jgi:hypothetical protein
MPHVSRPRREVLALTVDVLLPNHPRLDPETSQVVRTDVAAFVVSQVNALPSFLKLPYLLAMTAFDLLPLLRKGRPFRRLDAAARANAVAAWDTSALAPKRNYTKLIRSCALLAYYDHPAVLNALHAEEMATARPGGA